MSTKIQKYNHSTGKRELGTVDYAELSADVETNFDSRYLRTADGTIDSITGLGTVDGIDVLLIEDASDAYSQKKVLVSDLLDVVNAGYWDTIYELGSQTTRTGTTAEVTLSGSSNSIDAGTYEIELNFSTYSTDSVTPEVFPEFEIDFSGTAGGLENIYSPQRALSISLNSFHTFNNHALNNYWYKGVFDVTTTGNISLKFRASTVSANVCYAEAGTGYKLRKIA